HYDKWYYPNNASLVVVGGIDPDKALAKIKELFGPIPKGKLPERKTLPAEKTKRPGRVEFESKFETARLLMGFNGGDVSNPDAPALDVLQVILAGGRTSRLYRKLIEGEEVADSASAANNTGRYPGWFAIQVALLKGKDRNQVEQLVLKEIERLRKEPVTPAELKRGQQTVLSSTVFARESDHDLADSLAQGVTTADLDWLKNYLPKLMAVTAQDVQRVAQKYLDPEQRVVVWSVPKEKKEGGKEEKPKPPARSDRLPRAAGPAGISLKDAQRVELPNGLVLLLYENHRLPIVVADASVRDVHLREPEDKAGVAVLTGRLLDEGTAKHTGQQIAETM